MDWSRPASVLCIVSLPSIRIRLFLARESDCNWMKFNRGSKGSPIGERKPPANEKSRLWSAITMRCVQQVIPDLLLRNLDRVGKELRKLFLAIPIHAARSFARTV